MYKGKTILALIPARGGSKGVPRKNIRRFFGKPLIAWAIKGARNSKYVDRVVVSTDDKEIAAVSRRFLAETPFLRVKRLATSRAKGIDVVLDAIDRLESLSQITDRLDKKQGDLNGSVKAHLASDDVRFASLEKQLDVITGKVDVLVAKESNRP